MNEARIAVHNLRRAGKLFLTKNAYAVIVIVLALFSAAISFPYLPQQVTLLNVLTIGLPALVITFGRESGRQTDRKQFLREVGGFALFTGLALGLAGCAMLCISAYLRGDATPIQQTLLLATLVVLSVQTTWRVLRRNSGQMSANGWLLLAVSLAAIPLFFLTVYMLRPAQYFLLEPVAPECWLWVLAVAVPTAILIELGDRKLIVQTKGRAGSA
jgi:magnesium-transporting ATPase (P-type)